MATDFTVEAVNVSAYTVPTISPESDGRLEWDSTTMVLVEVSAGGKTGLGYTYADGSVAALISSKLLPLLDDHDPMSPPATSSRRHALRP